MIFLMPLLFSPIFMRILNRWIRLSKINKTDPLLPFILYLGLSAGSIYLLQIFSSSTHLPKEILLIELFSITLVSLGIIDAITGYLPNALTIPLVLSGVVANLFGKYAFSWHLLGDPVASIEGAILGYGLLYFANQVHLKIKGVDGLGMGDAKLLAAIGAWFGPMNLIMVMATASALSLAIPLAKWMLRINQSHSLSPFGPFLAVGGFISIFTLPL